MSVDKHIFIVPLQTMTRTAFERYLKDRYDFLDPEFVLRNALQLWIDYLQDPDGQWYLNVEDEIHREYGKLLNYMAGRMIFREGKNSKILKRKLDYKSDLVDTMASEIGKHITFISNYISDRLPEEELEDIVLDSEYEVLVKSGWVAGRAIKFIIEEV